jgi:hypothetical protein
MLLQPSRLSLWGVLCALPLFWVAGWFSPPTPIPQPIADPLAIPVLSENPTQVERGEASYYYNCMPCHGDQGQGLTDQFREIWVEDHQNCWAVGCHGGRVSDEGFPIPRTVPPVTGIRGSLQNASDLFTYLKETHPPQRPGVLEENDYWDLTGFILYKNGLQAANETSGPAHIQIKPWVAGLIFLTLLGVISISLIIQTRHSSWIGYNTKDKSAHS